jgi:hypothetical protein
VTSVNININGMDSEEIMFVPENYILAVTRGRPWAVRKPTSDVWDQSSGMSTTECVTGTVGICGRRLDEKVRENVVACYDLQTCYQLECSNVSESLVKPRRLLANSLGFGGDI